MGGFFYKEDKMKKALKRFEMIDKIQDIVNSPYKDGEDILMQLLGKVAEIVNMDVFERLKFDITFGDRTERFYMHYQGKLGKNEMIIGLGTKLEMWGIPDKFPDYDCTASFDLVKGEIVVYVMYR